MSDHLETGPLSRLLHSPESVVSDTDLQQHLEAFTQKFDIPAAVGGVVNADGNVRSCVVGTTQRGGDLPVEIGDQWHIGSCTKAITATLCACYVERGDLAWDSRVPDLLPDLTPQIDPGWQSRTLEELLLCTSGMQANPTVAELQHGWSDPRTLTEQRTQITLSALSNAPRQPGKFVYSNLGYIVVGAILDRLSGTSFEAALNELLLRPLDMNTVGYGPPPCIWGHRSKLQLASFALGKGPPMDPRDVKSDNPGFMSSAGTLHMSVADWSKFLSLFLGDNGTLLSRQTIDYLLTYPTAKRKDARAAMAMGWAETGGRIDGVAYGAQGSNTMWSACALINTKRTRAAFSVCNDGRTRILLSHPQMTAELLRSSA